MRAGVEFIEENGGGPVFGYESGTRKRTRPSGLGFSMRLDRELQNMGPDRDRRATRRITL